MTADVVVVGGGVAGLVTAWELARAGLRPRVLESASVVGGALAKHTVAGLDLDAGAESYATATAAVGQLIRELGLAAAMVAPDPVGAWVRFAGGSAPLPTAALLGIPSRPFAADVRRVLGVAGSVRAGLDLLLPAGYGDRDDISLGALVGSRMGRTVVDRLVEPVAGGVYSTDPDELDADTVAPRLRGALRREGSLAGAVRRLRGGERPGSAVAGLAGGMFQIVVALSQVIGSLGGRVSTGVRVDGLRPADGSWRLTTSVGDLTAARVVLAVPGPAVIGLLAQAGIGAPALSASTSDVLLATLVVDAPGLDTHPRGTGVLVSARATGVRAKALTHASAKWAWLAAKAGPSRHVLRLSYGRGAGSLPDRDSLVELALTDAGALTGICLPSSALVDADVIQWTSALPRPQPGHRAAMDRMRGQIADRPGLYLTGSMVAGTGLASVVADARAVAATIIARPPAGSNVGYDT